jgi:spore maturation protein CgeB
MRVVLFCHSLISDWNHGNAHLLRGVAGELIARGHDVDVFEPHDSWSRQHLLQDEGPDAVQAFHRAFPHLSSRFYDLESLDLGDILAGADLVLVHEWNDPRLVAAIGRHRRVHRYVLLFHDTHHRTVTDPQAIDGYDLQDYDGVLAFGEVIRLSYERRGWARRAWTWHEGADVPRFHPREAPRDRDLVWIGNWGDEERSEEIGRYLIDPVRQLGLRATVHGVRYPARAQQALTEAGIDYRGWLPNHRVPEVFASHAITVHIPRRPYVERLPGIPTIRMFEALACGIPLVSAWWDDTEHLFEAGRDYLVVRSSEGMTAAVRAVLSDPDMSAHLTSNALHTVRTRHTCAHRVDELLGIVATLVSDPVPQAAVVR